VSRCHAQWPPRGPPMDCSSAAWCPLAVDDQFSGCHVKQTVGGIGSDIVGDSGQGYVRRIDCVRMAQKRNPDAELVIDEPKESNDSQRP
jgi:hypothetical protein